jgi:nucleoside-diphosphate-sugar epimerase
VSRVLVTGATGFVGLHAVPALRAAGHDVVAVGRADADLLDPAAAGALCESVRPSHLLHLAWYAEHGRYWTAAVNLDWAEATLRLLRAFAASGGERAVLAGSSAVYAPDAGWCVESVSPTRPATLYGTAKLATGEVACAAGDVLGIQVVDARLFQLFGPGEDERRLVPAVATALLRGERAACTAGEQQRDFISVVDTADALTALVAGEVTGPVNVGSGTATRVADVAMAIGSIIGRPDLVDLGAIPSTDDIPLLAADVTRLTAEAGWRGARPLAATLAETIDWWRARVPA